MCNVPIAVDVENPISVINIVAMAVCMTSRHFSQACREYAPPNIYFRHETCSKPHVHRTLSVQQPMKGFWRLCGKQITIVNFIANSNNKASEEFIFVASESAEMVAEVAVAGASRVLESTEVFIRHSPNCGMGTTVISQLGNWTHSVRASEAHSSHISCPTEGNSVTCTITNPHW